MEDLVVHIARGLVDHPDQVQVSAKQTDDGVTFELKVAQEDLGKVIGKQGRTARAMRSLLSAKAAQSNTDARLDIVE
ncbi:MAG: KH domain-containing protein [Desulfofustis sp.]|jgi:predicted RNA-binding protein YlqC (UPF0109 family)|nr:KH domain-containing protein [Desulfofustis sp.]